jgi:hypothetical protein
VEAVARDARMRARVQAPHSNLTGQAARRRMRQHGCRRRALPPHPGVVALEELAVTLEVQAAQFDGRPSPAPLERNAR